MAIAVTSAATRGRVTVTNLVTGGSSGGEWLANRDNFPLNVPTTSVNTNDTVAIQASWTTSGGGNRSTCSRYYMAFSTLSVPVQANTITLMVYAGTNITSDIMVVQATAPTTSSNISGSDYKAILGYIDGDTMSGNVIDFIDGGPIFLTTGWNAITLNANAANTWNSTNTWQLALVNGTYDYGYTEPSLPSLHQTAISALSFPPYLVVTTGVGQWVLSIDPTAYANVNSVLTANIEFVNRIGSYPLYATVGSAASTPGSPVCNLTFSGTNPIYCIHGQGSIVVGDFIYTDPAMTTPFIGGNLYYGIWDTISSPSWSGDVYQISNTGEVMAINNCAW